MAYLNANIPVEYAQIRREYLYDLKKHKGEVEDCIIFGVTSITGKALLLHAIMEKLRTALSSALPVLLGVLYYFMLSWKTVQSFTDSLLRRLFNVDSKSLTSQGDDLMSFSSGTLLVIILLFIVGIF